LVGAVVKSSADIVGYGGIGGTVSLGGDERVGEVTLFSAKGWGDFSKLGRKKILPFEHFGALLGQRRHKNRSNRPFGTILSSF
jgi:hypothetical protein